MYFIYALFFEKDRRIYVGMTGVPKVRMKGHKYGKTRSTKNRGDFIEKIIDKAETREEARKREKYWKSGYGKERLKNIAGWSNGSSRGS